MPLPAATTMPPPAAVITPFPVAATVSDPASGRSGAKLDPTTSPGSGAAPRATTSDPAVGSAGIMPGPGPATLPVDSASLTVAQDRVDAVVRARAADAGGVASESLSALGGQAAALTTFPADFEAGGDPAGRAVTGSGGEPPAASRRNRPTPGALVSGPVPATAVGRFRGVRANSRFGLA
jgi:hypothetical protein